MTEQNAGWRDISTAPLDGTVVLVREKDGCVYSANFCAVEESWKLADQDGMRWNDDLELVAHWKALPPPPGEEVEDWYALGVKDGRDGCLVELDALQARCDKLEAERNQVIQELLEKAEGECRQDPESGIRGQRRPGEDPVTYGVRLRDAEGAVGWLKSQMEGE